MNASSLAAGSAALVSEGPRAAVGAAPRTDPARHRTARVVLHLARFTLLEAWRSRWLAAALLMAAAIAATTAFTAATALTEVPRVALSIAAPLARLSAVLLLAIFAVTALARELNDGSVDLVLAAPVSRLTWIAGRWLGLVGVAAGTALAAAAPLALHAPSAALLAWTASLWLELCLVGGLALLLSISFGQLPAALLSLLAFYTMARLVGVVMLLNGRAPLEAPAVLVRIGDGLLGLLGHVLPRLDLFTRTDWLLGAGVGWADGARVAVQVLIWLVLVPAVGWLDFGRRRG